MLTACASFGTKTPPAITPDPSPVIEVHYETRVVCPPELRLQLPERPSLPADAVVQTNSAGGQWLAQMVGWANALGNLMADARAACPDGGQP